MVVLQALLALLGRSAGKILNAAFGWAVRALFGASSGRESMVLTALVALAAIWPLLALGVVAPKIAVFALTFVPLPKWVSGGAIRIFWICLALLIPLLLGVALNAKQPAASPEESRLTRVLRGFPATMGLAVAFWITLVSVPILHVVALLRGRRDAHIPLITKEETYWEAAERIQSVLNRRGFDLVKDEAPYWLLTSMAVLRALGGDAMRRYVPERLAHLSGPRLEVTLHPSSLLLRGPQGPTTIAHGLVAEALTTCDAFQSTDPKAQEIEREIKTIWQELGTNGNARVPSSAVLSRFRDVSHEIGRLETSYDDWQTVYRQALQLGRALRGEPQLLAATEKGDLDRTA